jgi:hypothetical protein
VIRAAARYLALRASIARRYEESALDALLRGLDRDRGTARSLDDLASGVRIGEAIARRARLGPDTCLFRALARYALLRRAGHAARFCMSVDDADPSRGHAWVEVGGAPWLEPASPPYRRTFEHAAHA